MSFFNVQTLTTKLREHSVSGIDKITYFLLFFAQLIFHITPVTWIPTLYALVFRQIQHQLDITVQVPALTLTVYETINHLYPFFFITVYILFFIWIYKLLGNNKIPCMVERIICLQGPISMRIMFFMSCLFLIAIGVVGYYFTSKLLMLTQAAERTPGVWNSLYRLGKKINIVGKLWNALTTLKEAEAIYKQMNLASLYFYWTSQILAIISTVWYFRALKKYVKQSHS